MNRHSAAFVAALSLLARTSLAVDDRDAALAARIAQQRREAAHAKRR